MHRYIAALTYTLLATLVLSGCESGEPERETPPRVIAWAEVKSHSESDALRRLAGVVRAVKRASVGFEVGGTLAAVEVDVGDRFEREQLLAKLDQHEFSLRMARAGAADTAYPGVSRQC